MSELDGSRQAAAVPQPRSEPPLPAAASLGRQQVILSKMPPPVRRLRPLMLRAYRRRVAVLVPA